MCFLVVSRVWLVVVTLFISIVCRYLSMIMTGYLYTIYVIVTWLSPYVRWVISIQDCFS